MGWFRAAVDWLTTSPVPSATFSASDVSAPKPIDQLFAELAGRYGDGPVSRDQALSVPTVQRGRNLLCSVATLPLALYDPAGQLARSPLLQQIDPDVPNVVTLSQTIEDLIFEGIAWWKWLQFDAAGFPVAGRRVAPALVSIDPPEGRSPSPLPSGHDPREQAGVWIDGVWTPAREVCRFDSPNPALLRHPRAIRRALLLDQTAAMYANDPRPLDYFTPSDGVDPVDDDEVVTILRKWRTARRTRSTGYVPAALKYNTVEQPTPADLQLVDLQRQAGLEVANLLGVDPEELGISTTSRTYANAVDRRRDRVNDVYAPIMRALTDRLSMGDVTRRGYVVAFNLDDYMKPNPTERWNVYKIGKELGVIDEQYIAAVERLPKPPAAAPAAADGKPSLRVVRDQGDGAAAARAAAVTFDDQVVTFDAPITHGFSVDVERRTIRGRAVPYGVTGLKYGMKFRFAAGSLQYSDVGRVKLLRDHDPRQAIGYATEITDTPDGVDVAFRVAAGAAGDEALALAAEGVLDGLSVGVVFDPVDDAEFGEDGVLDVKRADWKETSLTAIPAFDAARVTSVAASWTNGGNTMLNPPAAPATPAAPAATPAAPAAPAATGPNLATPQTGFTLSADALAELGRQVAAQLSAATLLDQMGSAALPEQRQVVNPNPTRSTVSTSVVEPTPYRFDAKGNLQAGSHDFSQDLFNGWQVGDQAARDRAESFVREQFAVTPSNVSALNPNRQRPDMYVDQMEYEYPIWQAIDKGTLGDVTPFTFPKFNAATGLVADHTSGTEPTPGSFSATNQTVTPTPVSGKVEILRETWDQGGNPQVSGLIWNQMRRGWFEALEAFAVAQFVAAAASMTDITITTAAADSALDQAVGAAVAPLHFIRGGKRFRKVFTQVDLYTKLATAKDSTGRPLYPVLGPTNAAGTQTEDMGIIRARGLDWIPAWALAASSINAASSYMFDPDKVHGWASTPQRIDLQWRVAWVDVGLWGYKAFAISDYAGTRELVYDPQ